MEFIPIEHGESGRVGLAWMRPYCFFFYDSDEELATSLNFPLPDDS